MNQASVRMPLRKAEVVGVRPKRIAWQQQSMIDWFGGDKEAA